jgi:hypothetical protein
LTITAPVFPVIIIVLVPVGLLVMNRMWNRETLTSGGACNEGMQEDEDRQNGMI